MAIIITSLDGLTSQAQIDRAILVSGGLRANINVPDGGAWADDIEAETNNATADMLAQKTAQQVAENATRKLQETLRRLGLIYAKVGLDVQRVTDGDEAKIATTYYQVRKTPGASKEMPKVEEFGVTMGDEAGELDVHWHSVPNVQSYAVQFTVGAEMPSATQWQNGPPLGRKSKATLENLPSGARVWARGCAVGALGAGSWSDPAFATVP